MSRTRRDNRVYRAEFRDWLVSGSAGVQIQKGAFVVEVRLWDDGRPAWAAMINGDRGRVLCFDDTAAKTKARVRGHFKEPLCDWFVGEKVNGQWKPADEAREKQLRRGA